MDVDMVTDFWRKPAQIGMPHLESVRWHSTTYGEDHNTDARVNTADEPSTSDNKSVNFPSVTPEFCRCVCAERATRWLCHALVMFQRQPAVTHLCCSSVRLR